MNNLCQHCGAPISLPPADIARQERFAPGSTLGPLEHVACSRRAELERATYPEGDIAAFAAKIEAAAADQGQLWAEQ